MEKGATSERGERGAQPPMLEDASARGEASMLEIDSRRGKNLRTSLYDRIIIIENLKKRMISVLPICPFCGQEDELTYHLLLNDSYSQARR